MVAVQCSGGPTEHVRSECVGEPGNVIDAPCGVVDNNPPLRHLRMLRYAYHPQ